MFIPPQDALYRIYPNLFQLLWHSMPPCFPSEDNPESPHMLSRCSWQGNDVKCSEIFTPVVTDSGVCCAFNLQDNLRDSEFTRLVQSMQEPKTQKKEEIRKVVSGLGRGLEVFLDQNSHRSKPSAYKDPTICRVSDKSVSARLSGFRLFLGHPSEFPLLQRRHLILRPGLGHSVQVSASHISTNTAPVPPGTGSEQP